MQVRRFRPIGGATRSSARRDLKLIGGLLAMGLVLLVTVLTLGHPLAY